MTNGEKPVNPLREEASPLLSGNQKKKTPFAGLFFLTGLRLVPPLGQCAPSKGCFSPKIFAQKSSYIPRARTSLKQIKYTTQQRQFANFNK